ADREPDFDNCRVREDMELAGLSGRRHENLDSAILLKIWLRSPNERMAHCLRWLLALAGVPSRQLPARRIAPQRHLVPRPKPPTTPSSLLPPTKCSSR